MQGSCLNMHICPCWFVWVQCVGIQGTGNLRGCASPCAHTFVSTPRGLLNIGEYPRLLQLRVILRFANSVSIVRILRSCCFGVKSLVCAPLFSLSIVGVAREVEMHDSSKDQCWHFHLSLFVLCSYCQFLFQCVWGYRFVYLRVSCILCWIGLAVPGGPCQRRRRRS